MNYVDELARELRAAGIRSRLRGRIVAEIEDHLESEPRADLGAPEDLARQFADELGTSLALRSARHAFFALALGGVCFVAIGSAASAAGVAWSGTRFDAPLVGVVATVGAALASQVALAAGLLGMWRAWRLRREPVIPRAEAIVLGRRAGVGLVSGMVALATLAVAVLELKGTGSWWRVAAVAGGSLGELSLLAALPAVAAAARVRPTRSGSSGDLVADFAPIVPEGTSTTGLAVIVAAGIAVLIAAAGAIGDDPLDGALRGLADGTACLAGFVVLGRYLGLRRSN